MRIKKKAAPKRPPQPDSAAVSAAVVEELFRLGIEQYSSERQFAIATGIDRGTLRCVRSNPSSCSIDKLVSIAWALGFDSVFEMFSEVKDALGFRK